MSTFTVLLVNGNPELDTKWNYIFQMYYDHYREIPVCNIYAKWTSKRKISYLIGIRLEMYVEFPYINTYLFMFLCF